MTVLTRLQSVPAQAQAITPAGNLRGIYETLLREENSQGLAQTFLNEQLQRAAALPEELPHDPST
ncbi:MAG: iron-containing redox enzyme family protein, partial [Pseudomonas sp.]